MGGKSLTQILINLLSRLCDFLFVSPGPDVPIVSFEPPKTNAGAKKATEQMCTTLDVSGKANLGHVWSAIFCIIQTTDLAMAATKVFLRMSVNDFGMLNRMFNKTTE